MSSPWFGEAPPHWQASRLSRWYSVSLGKMLDESKFATAEGEMLPYIRAGNVRMGSLDLANVKSMPFSARDRARFSLRAGDLVVVEGGSIGVNARITQDMPGWGYQKTVNRVRAKSDASTAFLGYQIDALRAGGAFDMIANVSTIQHLTAEKLERLVVHMPPPSEQRAIADYLDRETAQIDAFIAKNEELITLLTERRTSVIREATTVGLETKTELVESGLDGVGPIPSDWRVMRLSWLFRGTGSGTTPSSEFMLDGDEADVWWVTTGELRERTIMSTSKGVSFDTLATTSALKIHPSGSLLIAMYGATIGRTGILGVPAASNQAVCALSNPVGCLVEFVEYAMLAARERLLLAAVGGGQPNINQETVRAFRIPVPDFKEQRTIVQYLRARVAGIDRAIAAAGRGIELARERRAALISAAVTGKIDVGVGA
ncbi:restriction endonuclease subunit S [Microbacterium sp. BG28]|uniref:restriction endonuclease subunit S n=1 Tax=Microbacterium sp. BG28 TaxID=3097356 RepID=UPI002A5A083F|nr:restriction endonuclease subunit S [Microbacterium sp. BG28]MDY0828457.1 restriction endonuclease subunit S [Microbacterium sp. BG28]